MEGRPRNGSQNGKAPLANPTTEPSTRAPDRTRDPDRTAASSGSSSSNNSNGVNTSTRATTFRSNPTIRAVTPEAADLVQSPQDAGTTQMDAGVPVSQSHGPTSPHTSPRSIPGGERRRQGIIFNDTYGGSYDSSESSPPQQKRASVRPRTHTVDSALGLRQTTTASSAESRHRVGSFSSAGSKMDNIHTDVDLRPPTTVLEPPLQSPITPSRVPELKINPLSSSIPMKDKKSANRRLIKRTTSRPTSPLVSPPLSVDSLPLPIPTKDANKILYYMKTLCGRMRGEIEYQTEAGGAWTSGPCFIDDERGALLLDPRPEGSFPVPIVGDLRGCRVIPVENPDSGLKCLELVNPRASVDIVLRPLKAAEFDYWLAAFLCWQQVRTNGSRIPSGRGSNSPVAGRSETRRRGSSANGSSSGRDATIIKVGKVMLWDKGIAMSPRAIVKRPSTRDLLGSATAWKRVSCILQDNGEFKLMTENDVTVLSLIELSQLSRSAIQQLDKSVLDEEYCIAIFPIYASNSSHLSIFRPVYLALDSRVLFEVWFVLLRAFAIPDLCAIDSTMDRLTELSNFDDPYDGQLFRLEKIIHVRVVEAKLRKANELAVLNERPGRTERDPLAGNYLAEVILDGEVRARTTTQPDTRNPFWRDTCQFTELPGTLPSLSVVLKRVDGNLDGLTSPMHGALALQRSGANLTEVTCGGVDIPLDRLEKGKDHEQWFIINDERQDVIGSIFVKILHEEHVVLMQRDYAPLSELLHKFSVGLTGQIASAMPAHLRRLAEIFINIFQVSNSSSEWLMNLVEEEIDGLSGQNKKRTTRFSRRLKSNESTQSASERELIVRDMGKSLTGEANLLFRGNSLLTQALEFHMRRLGKEYLEEILSDKLFEINEINPDCEVDPSRMQHGDDLHQHWAQLMQLTTEVWECIAMSSNRLPTELRQILKYVRAVADDRYGDFLRTVTYTSVSGFLFLRFICPAILNPKLFGLLRDNPRARAQRTFTLIAKGLQALGNLSTFGKKESWMEPMNRFLNSQRQPFKDFIDTVCDVSAERTTQSVPATYTTPITILGRLSPTLREGFPALPYLIDHARNFASLVKMWLEHNKPGNSDTVGLEGELLDFHNVCIALQARSDECMARVEAARMDEGASVATDDLADSLDRTTLSDSVTFPGTGAPSWLDSDMYYPPGSSGSDVDGASASREVKHSNSREGSALRQVSDGSEYPHVGGTLRRTGKHNPRAFLSGLIGSKNKERDKERDKDKDKEKEKDRDRSRMFGTSPATMREKSRDKEERNGRSIMAFSDSWHSDNSRH